MAKEIDNKLIEEIKKETKTLLSKIKPGTEGAYYHLQADVNMIIRDYLTEDDTTSKHMDELLQKIKNTSLEKLAELAKLELEMNMKFYLTPTYSRRLGEAYEKEFGKDYFRKKFQSWFKGP